MVRSSKKIFNPQGRSAAAHDLEEGEIFPPRPRVRRITQLWFALVVSWKRKDRLREGSDNGFSFTAVMAAR